MKRIFSAAVVIAALTVVPVSPSPASAEVPMCRGREATHVGTPGGELRTTPGPDVVVTNGASEVHTLNGNDVICATRSRFVYIVPGGGDDIVDATRFDGDNLQTSLGDYGVDGSSGDDRYFGGDQVDQVFVSSGVAADRKQIHTDGGKDYLNVDRRYLGGVTARLGVGRDEYWNDRPRAGVEVRGEDGNDQFVTECIGCRTFTLRLAPGSILVDGAPSGTATGFVDAELINFGSRPVRSALVIGTARPNRIDVIACHATGEGRVGDDSILVGALREDGCRRITGIARGEEGDDSLTGIDGDDFLRGGIGDDGADGQRGSDFCRAEAKTDCER